MGMGLKCPYCSFPYAYPGRSNLNNGNDFSVGRQKMVQCIAANRKHVWSRSPHIFLATNIGNLWGCVFFSNYSKYIYIYIHNYIYIIYIIYYIKYISYIYYIKLSCPLANEYNVSGLRKDKSVRVYQFIRWTSTLNVRCQQTSLASTSVRLNIQCKRLVKFEIRERKLVWCNYCILFLNLLCQFANWTIGYNWNILEHLLSRLNQPSLNLETGSSSWAFCGCWESAFASPLGRTVPVLYRSAIFSPITTAIALGGPRLTWMFVSLDKVFGDGWWPLQ